MKKFLVQRWFLILMVVGVAVALVSPGGLYALTQRLNPRVVIALALFLMAYTMPSRSLAGELREPWAALWAVAISYGFLPAMAWILGELAPLEDVRIGILIVVSGPCTLASAVIWTRLAGGNEATALLTVVIGTFSSCLVTTAWLLVTTGTSIHLNAAEMILDLVLILVLPVGLGQVARAWQPLAQFANRGKTFLSVLAQLLVLFIILKTASEVGIKIEQRSANLTLTVIGASAVLAIGLHLFALAGGWLSSGWLHFDRARRIGIAFSCSQKTLPVALTLFEGFYREKFPLAVLPLFFFHIGQLVLDTFIADRLSRQGQAREDLSSPRAPSASR